MEPANRAVSRTERGVGIFMADLTPSPSSSREEWQGPRCGRAFAMNKTKEDAT